ncbi:Serine/threonine-protein kinase pkn1 [Rubripirellula amarantea]|uniref:Serine/threonine-protein kinase pkn1 n=1 Tax=Rubripirellula amarantea TaxID=2527999 RepID=A0A5C5WSL4_9BACT|nr:formylglycine-generating enzyme family protein [Rubripirellula amarantea]TWT53151.1 Serine/threonine-protein kinase pkn1 [Rubripirellula amarantea]
MRLNRNFACFFVAMAGLSPTWADAPTATVGISETKPADGPSVEVDGGFMVPYTEKIPGTDLTFEMIPVPGGSFLMGSPEDEEGRREDEGPQVKVNVDPMWVAKTEINWAQYDEYMNLYKIFKEFESQGIRSVTDDNKADAITAPTELYDSTFTWEFGHEPEQAAVTMTQYSAQQFSKWLSRVTGQQYRLPTEAEWEYAARGGTQTPFYWGDDEAAAEDHAWYFDNTPDEGQSPVGTLAENPFGLQDMLGNVFEWTVNQHTEDYSEYKQREPINAIDVVKWPEIGSECVVRGGSWESDVEDLRCAARLASDDEAWKEEDPNFPRSPWWFTSDPARGVGFRLFRSYKPLDDELITKFWEASAEDVIGDVESRIQGGRGGLGIVDPSLPDAIKELDN